MKSFSRLTLALRPALGVEELSVLGWMSLVQLFK